MRAGSSPPRFLAQRISDTTARISPHSFKELRMSRCIRPAAILFAAVFFTCVAPAQDTKRPIQVDDLFKFKRVGPPQLSPDGKLVAYHLTTMDVEANKSSA